MINIILRGGADKSLARPTSRCRRTESIVSWKDRIASFFLLQRLKGSMSCDARDFNNIETRTVIKLFSPYKARRRRKFTPFWQKHYGNMQHRKPPSKTGWPSLNTVIFPPVVRLVLGDPKQWPPPRLLIKFTSESWKAARFRLNQ